MDWNNVDLKNDYERDQSMLSEYTFDTLLLEISCNLKEINEETVKKQFETSIKLKIAEARRIFVSNLNNITIQAQAERRQS